MKRAAPVQNRITPKLTRQMDKHFVACCAAAAGAACLAGPQEAHAAIIYSGVQNVPIFPGSVNGGVYIDLEPNFVFDQGNRPAGWDINPYFSGKSLYMNGNAKFVKSGSLVANLPVGTVVDGSSTFSALQASAAVAIAVGGTGYIGFAFDPDAEPGAQTRYGWIHMSVGDDVSVNGSVIDWAYDNTGAPIQAGAVPEPSSLALLAMGAAGIMAFRRRTSSTK